MPDERIPTGVPGFDPILGGGLLPRNLYLLKGAPGTGKTTLALQFLLEGARRGERCLYIGLSETRGQLVMIAEAYGWALDGIEVHDMRRRGETAEGQRKGYTVFSPSEVELEEISRELLGRIEQVRPDRLVIDSLSEIRLVAEDPFRYRRELLNLSDQIAGRFATALLIDVDADDPGGRVAETLVSGVIQLEQLAPPYGGERRRLRVRKLRASRSIGGFHDLAITGKGIELYPRLVAASHRAAHSSSVLSSGIVALDALLGGGLDRGTSTVLIGSAGTGKSTVASQFVATAAARGESGVMFCFDESPSNLLARSHGLGIPLAEHVESGRVRLVPVDPAELSPGELAHRAQVEIERGVRVVVVDSINGYVNAMPDERFLAAHMHELLSYLSEKSVTTLLTLAQQGLMGADTPMNISYIADTVILFRYFEVAGVMKKAISVVKKRTGMHEHTIRELRLGPVGLDVGKPLTQFQGVLTGNPTLTGIPSGGEREPLQ
jgi:circadian clock protein KaiC